MNTTRSSGTANQLSLWCDEEWKGRSGGSFNLDELGNPTKYTNTRLLLFLHSPHSTRLKMEEKKKNSFFSRNFIHLICSHGTSLESLSDSADFYLSSLNLLPPPTFAIVWPTWSLFDFINYSSFALRSFGNLLQILTLKNVNLKILSETARKLKQFGSQTNRKLFDNSFKLSMLTRRSLMREFESRRL